MKVRKKSKLDSGITLVALVVTIIILLILAGVTVSIVLNNTGLIKRATSAGQTYSKASESEYMNILMTKYKMEKIDKNTALEDFLIGQVADKKIDSYEETDEGYEIINRGFVTTVNKEGKIIIETQLLGPRPEINNITIKLEDGTDAENGKSEAGTKMVINFDTSLENGTITKVEPALPYKTNGEEKNIKFTVEGEINGIKYLTHKKISVAQKYENIYELSANSLIDAFDSNDLNSGKAKITVNDEIYNLHIYAYEGDTILTENTTLGTASDVGTATSEAKNMVVMNVKGNLIINEGVTLTTYSTAYGGPKGFFIYCSGTIINNGTITMTKKGAYAHGQNVYLLENKTYDDENSKYEYVPAVGSSGGAGFKNSYWGVSSNGNNGNNGTSRKTAGGGSGAVRDIDQNNSTRGGNGTSYSGGTGSGGMESFGGIGAASDIGGKGGDHSYGGGAATNYTAGGAGNPGGSSGSYAEKPENGTGGLLIIKAKNINGNGIISANGARGGNNKPGENTEGGGSSGGGSINIFYENEINISYDNSYLMANGGARSSGKYTGGAGGVGSISVGKIVNGTYESTYKNY